MGNHARICVLPGFDIDAREVGGIFRPRRANTQREVAHECEAWGNPNGLQESFRRKAKELWLDAFNAGKFAAERDPGA